MDIIINLNLQLKKLKLRSNQTAFESQSWDLGPGSHGLQSPYSWPELVWAQPWTRKGRECDSFISVSPYTVPVREQGLDADWTEMDIQNESMRALQNSNPLEITFICHFKVSQHEKEITFLKM